MGYRSDVRIKVEFKKEVSKEQVKKFVKEFNDVIEIDKLLYNESENSIVISYNDIKWYEGSYDDVDAVMDLITDKGLELDDVRNSSILEGLQYIRIGESTGDTDERYYGSMNNAMWIETYCNFDEGGFTEVDDFLQ